MSIGVLSLYHLKNHTSFCVAFFFLSPFLGDGRSLVFHLFMHHEELWAPFHSFIYFIYHFAIFFLSWWWLFFGFSFVCAP
jgi:hypothetical protein